MCVVCRLEVEVEGVQSSNPRTGAVVPLTVSLCHDWHLGCILTLSLESARNIVSCKQVLRAIKVRLASVVLGA